MPRIIATIAAMLAIAIVFGTTMFDRTSPSNDAANYDEYKIDGRWADSYDKWVGLTADRQSVLGTYSIDDNGDTTLTDYGLTAGSSLEEGLVIGVAKITINTSA